MLSNPYFYLQLFYTCLTILVLYQSFRFYFVIVVPMLVNKLDTGEWLYVKNHDSVSLIQLFVFSTASFLLLGYIWNNIPIWDELETFGKDCLFSLLSIFIICLFFGISNSMRNVSWLTVFNYYLGKNSTSQFIFEKKVSAAKEEKKYILKELDLIRENERTETFDLAVALKKYPLITMDEKAKTEFERFIKLKWLPINPIIIPIDLLNAADVKKELFDMFHSFFRFEYLAEDNDGIAIVYWRLFYLRLRLACPLSCFLRQDRFSLAGCNVSKC